MSTIDDALGQFHADLERADHLLALVKSFRSFAGSDIPTEVSDGSVPWDEALTLERSARAVRTDLPILAGSILLYLCGRFEYFIRELVTVLADEMAAKAANFTDLPEGVRKELHARTLEIAQSPGRYGFSVAESEQLIIQLGSNLGGAADTPVSISSRVLSVTEANMSSRTLAEVLKRVDIREVWSDIGKQAPLKAHLATISDRECTGEAVSRLDAMMKERNAVAHPTGATTFPDPDQVIESSRFLRILSTVLLDIARIPR